MIAVANIIFIDADLSPLPSLSLSQTSAPFSALTSEHWWEVFLGSENNLLQFQNEYLPDLAFIIFGVALFIATALIAIFIPRNTTFEA